MSQKKLVNVNRSADFVKSGIFDPMCRYYNMEDLGFEVTNEVPGPMCLFKRGMDPVVMIPPKWITKSWSEIVMAPNHEILHAKETPRCAEEGLIQYIAAKVLGYEYPEEMPNIFSDAVIHWVGMNGPWGKDYARGLKPYMGPHKDRGDLRWVWLNRITMKLIMEVGMGKRWTPIRMSNKAEKSFGVIMDKRLSSNRKVMTLMILMKDDLAACPDRPQPSDPLEPPSGNGNEPCDDGDENEDSEDKGEGKEKGKGGDPKPDDDSDDNEGGGDDSDSDEEGDEEDGEGGGDDSDDGEDSEDSDGDGSGDSEDSNEEGDEDDGDPDEDGDDSEDGEDGNSNGDGDNDSDEEHGVPRKGHPKCPKPGTRKGREGTHTKWEEMPPQMSPEEFQQALDDAKAQLEKVQKGLGEEFEKAVKEEIKRVINDYYNHNRRNPAPVSLFAEMAMQEAVGDFIQAERNDEAGRESLSEGGYERDDIWRPSDGGKKFAQGLPRTIAKKGAVIPGVTVLKQINGKVYEEPGRTSGLLWLLLDISGSMEEHMYNLIKITWGSVLSAIKNHDRVALMVFSHAPEYIIQPTWNYPKVREELRSLQAQGGTTLTPALFEIDRMTRQAQGKMKPTVVIISDCDISDYEWLSTDGTPTVGKYFRSIEKMGGKVIVVKCGPDHGHRYHEWLREAKKEGFTVMQADEKGVIATIYNKEKK